jgi:hypothetical protein
MPLPEFLKTLGCSIKSAFTGSTLRKFQTQFTEPKFIVPLAYSVISVVVFALTYSLIGYKNIFETTEQCTKGTCPARDCSDATCPDKDKNIENSIVGSLMLQSNAMGLVIPINTLGNVLMTMQTIVSWFVLLAFIFLIIDP